MNAGKNQSLKVPHPGVPKAQKTFFFFSLNNTVHVAFYWILYSFIGLLAYISK